MPSTTHSLIHRYISNTTKRTNLKFGTVVPLMIYMCNKKGFSNNFCLYINVSIGYSGKLMVDQVQYIKLSSLYALE